LLLPQFSPSPPTAIAAVNAALVQAQSDDDRRYAITTVYGRRGGPDQQLFADLWVRGRSNYALRQTWNIGDAWVGGDQSEHWLALPVGPVFVSNDPGVIGQFFLGEQVAAPFLQLTSILERMSDKYELRLVGEEMLPAANGLPEMRCLHVSGRQRPPGDPLWPDTMELWTTRDTGLAYKVQVRWNGAAEPGFRSIDLQWRPLDEPLPANWYRHETHHAEHRPVVHRPSPASPN
jgi:hypothetical protein